MRFFGLIGKSLEHSFSAAFFKEKFEKEGIKDCFYNMYPLKNIDELTQLINDFTELSGLNVTIPYKKEILPFLDEIDENARKIGAVNTINFERSHSKLILKGYNTDYLGFMDSIKPLLKTTHSKALILGTGGSSAAIKYALNLLGIKYKQVSRNPSDKTTLSYDAATKELVHESKIIINTTPLGMFPDISAAPLIPFDAICSGHLLYDLIYNPEKTEFLNRGKEKGARIKNGIEMLHIQAEYSWKIWNK